MTPGHRKTRILNMEEVSRTLPLRRVFALQEAAFIAQSNGIAQASPSSFLRTTGGATIRVKLLAGYVDDGSRALGAKVLARNPSSGKGARAIVVLLDPDDGFPVAIMDGTYLTAARTGSAAAVAARALAHPDATVVGVLGAGVIAWYSMLSLAAAGFALGSMVVCSRSREHARDLAARVSALLGIDARTVDSAAEVVAVADVVLTATESPWPLFDRSRLRPRQHLSCMGVRTEIAPGVVAASRVVPDSRVDAITEGCFSVALAEGLVSEADLGPELGEVLAGTAPGRRSPEDVTLFDSCGLAVQDIVCAREAWEHAEREGLGLLVDFGSDDLVALGESVMAAGKR